MKKWKRGLRSRSGQRRRNLRNLESQSNLKKKMRATASKLSRWQHRHHTSRQGKSGSDTKSPTRLFGLGARTVWMAEDATSTTS